MISMYTIDVIHFPCACALCYSICGFLAPVLPL